MAARPGQGEQRASDGEQRFGDRSGREARLHRWRGAGWQQGSADRRRRPRRLAGQVGEIVTAWPELFLGYTDPALDAAAFLPGRWYRTGDLGFLDADGWCLTVTDRLKDIIIRGGETISSKEIEDLLAEHPAVAEVAVVAAADPVMGERVCAVVVTRAGHSFEVAEARRYFAHVGVARQKTPEVVLLVEELPRTPAGKIQKFVLRALAAGEPG